MVAGICLSYRESLGIKTHLSEYGVRADQVSSVVDHLKAHGLTGLSETVDLMLELSRKILEKAL